MTEVIIPQRITHALGRVPANTGSGFLFGHPCLISPQPMSLGGREMAGYVKIWTTLLSNQAFLSLSASQRGLYLQLLIRCKEQRDDGVVCYRNVAALGSACGCDRKTAGKSLGKIAEKSLCTYTIEPSGVVTVIIPKYKKWQNLTAKEVVEKPRKNRRKIPPLRPDQTRPKQTNPPISPQGDDHIPYREIISDLNEVLKSSYRHKAPKTRQLIRSLWTQGFELNDFKYVHRVKAADWEHDPKFRKFLRPITLYSTKFEGYRNQPMPGDSPLDGLSEKGRATFLAGLRVVRQKEIQRERDEQKRLELQRDRE